MVELRWAWVDLRNDAPKAGDISVGGDGRTFQRLQYRTIRPSVDASGALCVNNDERDWSEWKDVPHGMVMTSNAEVRGGSK